MTKTIIIGSDISQDTIDICIKDKSNSSILVSRRIENNIQGFNALLKILNKINAEEVMVAMEATGKYHYNYIYYLSEHNIPFAVINPLRIKRFAELKMYRVKTDPVDAEIIANYGIYETLEASKLPVNERTILKEHIKVREHFQKELQANKNVLHSLLLNKNADKRLIKTVKSSIKHNEKVVEDITLSIKKIIDDNFKEEKKRIESVKGIGKATSAGIIAYLGDLSNFETHKQVSAFIGINPYVRQSGTSVHSKGRISKQGNTTLRTLFYLAALSASKHNIACKQLYQRLLAKGKQKKVALVAVANKLVKQLFTIIKQKTYYIDGYVNPKFA